MPVDAEKRKQKTLNSYSAVILVNLNSSDYGKHDLSNTYTAAS